MKQFNWGYSFMKTFVPEWIVSLVHPLTRQLFNLQHGIFDQVSEIKQENSRTPYSKETAHATIFHDLLSSKLPTSELTATRLTEEAITIIGAGTVTTAQTLATTLYYILSNPPILSRLRQELADLFLSYPGRPSWQHLEQLPYLSAVLSEGLRFSYGVSHRLQRISPDSPIQFREWCIPPGTPVSMTQMFIHEDPSIFERPKDFVPERWLEEELNVAQEIEKSTSRDTRSAKSPMELKRFLVPFSKGTRQCVGMNLAYSELYLTIGTLLKPRECGGLDLELYDTDDSDVDIIHDFFNPSPRLDSQGIRVIVKP